MNKHKGFDMYHPYVDSLASILAEYQFKFNKSVCYASILLEAVGLMLTKIR